MGFGIKELLIVLVIILLLFGTKKLRQIGPDLGAALKGFRKNIADQTDQDKSKQSSAEELKSKQENNISSD